MDFEIFETMYNTMLHNPDCNGQIKEPKERYPTVTYGLYTVNETGPVILQNDDSRHMEVKAMEELKAMIEQGQIQKPKLQIVLYSNWSPCFFCVTCILDFLQWSKDRGLQIRLTIKVAALYRITWPACVARGCKHLSFSSAYHQVHHQKAIKKLFRPDVSVEAFTKEDWDLIIDALGLNPAEYLYSDSGRQDTDNMVRRSLLDI